MNSFEWLSNPFVTPYIVEVVVFLFLVIPLIKARESILLGCKSAGLKASVVGALSGVLLLFARKSFLVDSGAFGFFILPLMLLVPGYLLGLLTGLVGQALFGGNPNFREKEPGVQEILNSPLVQRSSTTPKNAFEIIHNTQTPTVTIDWREFAKNLGI